MQYLTNSLVRSVTTGLVLVLLSLTLACNTSATPPPQPTTAPATAPNSAPNSAGDLAAMEDMVRRIVEASAPAPTPLPAPFSAEEIKQMVREATQETGPSVSRTDIEEVVAAALANTLNDQPKPVTKADIKQIVQDQLDSQQINPISGPDTPEPVGETKQPIVFSDLPWRSAKMQNRIAMYIIEHGFGYPVDTISGDVLTLWDRLLQGETQVTMEVWLPNQKAAWDQAVFDRSIISLGKSLDDNWQGFVIPTYTADGNRLTSFISIRKFVDTFDSPGGDRKAILVNCPRGSECHEINKTKIKSYGLEEHVRLETAESFADLLKSLESAYRHGDPWLGYMWGPSTLSRDLDLTVLKEPEYTDRCWDTNKRCAYPISKVLMGAHPSLATRAPEVVEFLSKWNFSSKSQVELEGWMDDNDATLEEAAVWFLVWRSKIWGDWVPEDVRVRIQGGLPSRILPTP